MEPTGLFARFMAALKMEATAQRAGIIRSTPAKRGRAKRKHHSFAKPGSAAKALCKRRKRNKIAARSRRINWRRAA